VIGIVHLKVGFAFLAVRARGSDDLACRKKR
jgi:hypothetical protein